MYVIFYVQINIIDEPLIESDIRRKADRYDRKFIKVKEHRKDPYSKG